jgi:hypothetical protein
MITASLRASATFALLMPARRAIRIAQLLSSEHPLIGLVSMRWAASGQAASFDEAKDACEAALVQALAAQRDPPMA